jgi:hypothetical protein
VVNWKQGHEVKNDWLGSWARWEEVRWWGIEAKLFIKDGKIDERGEANQICGEGRRRPFVPQGIEPVLPSVASTERGYIKPATVQSDSKRR